MTIHDNNDIDDSIKDFLNQISPVDQIKIKKLVDLINETHQIEERFLKLSSSPRWSNENVKCKWIGGKGDSNQTSD